MKMMKVKGNQKRKNGFSGENKGLSGHLSANPKKKEGFNDVTDAYIGKI